ncbi:FixH family protein [Acidovorax sp. GBBC 3334]|uniref:FixH family protein n=1 Tax=unclassified Acidovorax TaxID=2684926 RepID=UPI00230365CC|nr:MULTISPECIES: FixH family protein [unclassified Acidovorax]MDA8454194.1 FixH family protein [Acidovorax sp. GBBC 3334]MDA8520065.1 FixH family protein [Acidovorax sp. NCPPB 4044]
MTQQSSPSAGVAPQPWWKFGHVWLVIAGPAVVVVAGLATAWLAVSKPDPVLAEDYYRRGIEINRTLERAGSDGMAPAMKARNHAATPAQDRPR